MISKKTKYALKAMEYLALNSNGKPVLIAELASAGIFPRNFWNLFFWRYVKVTC
jgi:DNA-binding IscR family transcriptional regulator